MSELEKKLRDLVFLAWRAGNTKLAIELEASAFRCLGIDLNAEREAFLEQRAAQRAAAR